MPKKPLFYYKLLIFKENKFIIDKNFIKVELKHKR